MLAKLHDGTVVSVPDDSARRWSKYGDRALMVALLVTMMPALGSHLDSLMFCVLESEWKSFLASCLALQVVLKDYRNVDDCILMSFFPICGTGPFPVDILGSKAGVYEDGLSTCREIHVSDTTVTFLQEILDTAVFVNDVEVSTPPEEPETDAALADVSDNSPLICDVIVSMDPSPYCDCEACLFLKQIGYKHGDRGPLLTALNMDHCKKYSSFLPRVTPFSYLLRTRGRIKRYGTSFLRETPGFRDKTDRTYVGRRFVNIVFPDETPPISPGTSVHE
jgi:hypothetical protein